MGYVLLISIGVRLAAVCWSLWLLRRWRDWRVLLLTVTVLLMTVRQSLTLLTRPISWNIDKSSFTELPGLAVSILVLASLVLVEREIRRRREDLEALKNAESKLQLVLTHVPAVLWTTDRALNMTWAGGAGLSNFGYREEELTGRPLNTFFVDSGATEIQAHQKCLQGHSSGYSRFARDRHFKVFVEPLRDDRQAVIGCLGIAFDITELVIAREASEKRTEQLNALIGNSPLGIVVLDSDLVIRLTNSTFERAFGRDESSLEGERLTEMLGAPERDELTAICQEILEGESVQSVISVMGSKGNRLEFELFGVPLKQTGGAPAIQLLFDDITERRQLEQQLRHSQKMEAVGLLAGGVSHDFNNLLTVIRGNVDLLLEGLPFPNSELRDCAEQIRDAVERSAALTQQLLTFSRHQLIRARHVEMNRLIRRSHRLLSRLIGEDIELRVKESDNELFVRADGNQLEQVILNLTVNAREALPHGGGIELQIEPRSLEHALCQDEFTIPPGDYVRLSVRDNGLGMDESVRKRVFEPFFTTKSMGRGTGLGLASVYGIVKQFDGFVTVESKPGMGTCFSLYFPQVQGYEEGPERVPPRQPSGRPSSETILVAEDEEPVRRLVVQFLRREGYTVMEAKTPTEALELHRLYASEIDMLLTDVIMPEMGGKELSQRVKHKNPQLKVLFMSGYNSEINASTELSDPPTHLLAKPFTSASLLEKVREVLDNPGEVGSTSQTGQGPT